MDSPDKKPDGKAFMEYLKEARATESALANPIGAIPSHKLVQLDGLEPARFVFVVCCQGVTGSLFVSVSKRTVYLLYICESFCDSFCDSFRRPLSGRT